MSFRSILNGDLVEANAAAIGAGAKASAADVTSEADGQAAAKLALHAFGYLPGLVNRAGIAPGEKLLGKTACIVWKVFRVISVNLIETFNMLRLASFLLAWTTGECEFFLTLQFFPSMGITALGFSALVWPKRLQAFVNKNYGLLFPVRERWQPAPILLGLIGVFLIRCGYVQAEELFRFVRLFGIICPQLGFSVHLQTALV